MKHILIALLLFTPSVLFSYMEPSTIYTEDRYFITTGEVHFNQSMDQISIELLKYNNYAKWAFRGMDGVDKESEGLIVYFSEVIYSVEENIFLVTFDINLIWPFGKKGQVMHFKPQQEYNGDGDLKSITLTPLLVTKQVEEAEMIFYPREEPAGTTLYYESRIKLSRFLDFFFTLKTYKKNFEWYVSKMSENLYEYMQN